MKDFFLTIFQAAYMQRWNDKIRPFPLIEMDKQAHKFMILYLFGKLEEKTHPINWTELIEGFFFEFLQRLVVTDIKPTILDIIRNEHGKGKELDAWIAAQVAPIIAPLGNDFKEKYEAYFSLPQKTLTKRIIGASHLYASKWEFALIEKVNEDAYDINLIREWFDRRLESFYDLESIKQITLYKSYRDFIDLCGQLRYQIRWANQHRIPKTSVLGHSLFVALTSYLFSLTQNACEKRIYNNTFTGLFHDLPEVLTRDIITPVKRSIPDLAGIIHACEKDQMQKIVYPLLPPELVQEIKNFTESEFSDFVIIDGKITTTTSEEINNKFNQDNFCPRDGVLVKSADDFSAYLEAFVAIENGSANKDFADACKNINGKYQKMQTIGNYDIANLFTIFETGRLDERK